MIRLQGLSYCVDSCLERGLTNALASACAGMRRSTINHRIPIGLLLLSRQQLTHEELRSALETQRVAGYGRIGEWLQSLGYVREEQITAALARQWSCPILRGEMPGGRSHRAALIPLALMRWLALAPVDFVESTRTLHIAFSEGLDYHLLYAIELMLDCHTESCLVRPSVLRRHLERIGERHAESEVQFEQVMEVVEFARIIRSYAVRVAAVEIRVAGCGPHIWVRLIRPALEPMDLIVRQLHNASYSAGPAPPVSAAIAI